MLVLEALMMFFGYAIYYEGLLRRNLDGDI